MQTALPAFLILGGLGPKGYTLDGVRTAGLAGAAIVLAAFLGGATLGPILLPWLPGRAFSVKGAMLGLALAGGLAACGWIGPGTAGSWPHLAAWLLLVPSLASFAVMNFTGASTYTSLSGVLREMRFAMPAQVTAALLGFGFWLGGLYIA